MVPSSSSRQKQNGQAVKAGLVNKQASCFPQTWDKASPFLEAKEHEQPSQKGSLTMLKLTLRYVRYALSALATIGFYMTAQ